MGVNVPLAESMANTGSADPERPSRNAAARAQRIVSYQCTIWDRFYSQKQMPFKRPGGAGGGRGKAQIAANLFLFGGYADAAQ